MTIMQIISTSPTPFMDKVNLNIRFLIDFNDLRAVHWDNQHGKPSFWISSGPLWLAYLPLSCSVYLPPLSVWRADVWAVRWGGDSTGSPLLSNWLSHTASQSWQIGFLGIHEHVGVRPGIMWQGEGFNCRCKCACLTSHHTLCPFLTYLLPYLSFCNPHSLTSSWTATQVLAQSLFFLQW